jgi:PleD family two-component response regulator
MGKRVLVADDDDGVRRLITEALTEAGCECVPARDGVEALRLARAAPPDAIVLDAIMPYLSGDEVHEALRREVATRYVPVIFVTGQVTAKEKARRLIDGADDYVTKPFDAEELVARVTAAMRRSTELRALNPLSGLPGNVAISTELARRLSDGSDMACLYCDLDEFKAFNDHYGFTRGDEMIVLLARLLVSVAETTRGDAFVGHVGGDDFVVVLPEAEAEEAARQIVRGFDWAVPSVYDPADRDRGFIVRTDRRGIERNLPFVAVSIGIVPIAATRFSDAVAVSRAAAQVKEIAKRRDGSSWAVDRRQAAEGSAAIPVS